MVVWYCWMWVSVWFLVRCVIRLCCVYVCGGGGDEFVFGCCGLDVVVVVGWCCLVVGDMYVVCG